MKGISVTIFHILSPPFLLGVVLCYDTAQYSRLLEWTSNKNTVSKFYGYPFWCKMRSVEVTLKKIDI